MCADIHDGQEHKRSVEGRIQKRKTNHLQIITFGLQRTAGPYKGASVILSGASAAPQLAQQRSDQGRKPVISAQTVAGGAKILPAVS